MGYVNRPVVPPGGKKKKKSTKSGTFGGIIGGALGGFNFGQPAKTASTLAEAIEKQAASQKRQAEQKALSMGSGAALDPFSALQDQLFGAVNSINVAATPIEQLQKMAQQQAGLQFDPQIDALMAEMGSHSSRAERSAKTARQMYGDLSKDYLAQLPDITAQYKAEDEATNSRYDQSQQQMADEYQKNASQQDALLKQLGIQAAAPEASQQAKEDQAYFQNQAEMDQQSALDALNQQQMAQTDYQRNLGSNAKMAGANLSSDIGQQLNDYLDQAGAQKTSLEGQKSNTVAALLAQLQQQDAQNVATQRQQQFDNMMKLYGFQLDATKTSAAAASDATQTGAFGSEGTLTTGLPGAQNYLAGQYPDQPILASHLMEQINDVLSNKAVTEGKFVLDPGDASMGQAPKYSDVGQQYMEDLLRREFEKEGNRYSTRDINATMAALQAYLGKLR